MLAIRTGGGQIDRGHRWRAGDVEICARVKDNNDRSVSIVGPGNAVVHDSTLMLTPGDFEAAVRRGVPAEIVDNVVAWLDAPGDF